MAISISGSSNQSQDPNSNRSTVNGYGSMTLTVGYFSGLQSWGRVVIGGAVYDVAGPTSMSQGQGWSWSYGRTYDHDANGYRGAVDVSVSFRVDGTSLHQGSAGAGTQPALDYDRRPASPSITATRSVASVNVSLGSVSSPAGTPTYYMERSQNSGTWGDQKTGQTGTYSSLGQGTTQQFRSFATNSDGQSGYTYSQTITIPTVPSAPASLSVSSINGLDITVAIGASSSNGGSAITGYRLEYNNGSGWTGNVAVSPGFHTYINLTPGLTYTFRAYAINEMGNSAYATSAPVFLSAGGRRWTGSAFTPTTTAKRYDGTNWVNLTTGKRWNGTDWINLT